MNIKMRPGKLAVQKQGTTKKNQGAFVMPETIDSMGIIEFIADDISEKSGLKIGSKIFFGDRRQEIRMAGKDLQIMELENVIAIVEEQAKDETLQA